MLKFKSLVKVLQARSHIGAGFSAGAGRDEKFNIGTLI